MGRSVCPRCENKNLRRSREKRAMPNNETHEVTVWSCSNCGWQNI